VAGGLAADPVARRMAQGTGRAPSRAAAGPRAPGAGNSFSLSPSRMDGAESAGRRASIRVGARAAPEQAVRRAVARRRARACALKRGEESPPTSTARRAGRRPASSVKRVLPPRPRRRARRRVGRRRGPPEWRGEQRARASLPPGPDHFAGGAPRRVAQPRHEAPQRAGVVRRDQLAGHPLAHAPRLGSSTGPSRAQLELAAPLQPGPARDAEAVHEPAASATRAGRPRRLK